MDSHLSTISSFKLIAIGNDEVKGILINLNNISAPRLNGFIAPLF